MKYFFFCNSFTIVTIVSLQASIFKKVIIIGYRIVVIIGIYIMGYLGEGKIFLSEISHSFPLQPVYLTKLPMKFKINAT